MTGRAMAKPWVLLTAEAVADAPGQLGVFQLAEGPPGSETITRISYAGGREPFGMRSALTMALTAALEASTSDESSERWFRYELTHAYLTRWEELLMVHKAVNGELPPDNRDHPHAVGRLRLG